MTYISCFSDFAFYFYYYFMENCHTWIIISKWQNDLHTNTSRSVWPILYGLMIKMLQYKMYPAGELAVLRQLLFSYCSFQGGTSVAVFCFFVCLWVYVLYLFCPYLFLISHLLVPGESCASWLWHFLGIFTYITKTCLFKYTEKLITEKLKIFRQKIQIFFIFLLKT